MSSRLGGLKDVMAILETSLPSIGLFAQKIARAQVARAAA
jgi:hypothetical protein